MMNTRSAFSVIATLLILAAFNPPFAYSSTASREIFISDPVVRSLDGSSLTVVSIGQQALLSLSLTNIRLEVIRFIAIVEVRDEDGTTLYLQFQKGTLNGDSTTEIGISWTVPEIKDYDIRSFIVTDFENPRVLSRVSETSLIATGFGQLLVESVENQPTAEQDRAEEDNVDNPQVELAPQPSIGELREFALTKINQDREEYGLHPVALSNNFAAQAHADDLYKTRFHSSHWTSDGMKPYMKYTVYAGEGSVSQNVHAGQSYSDEDIDRCESGKVLCEKVNMKKQIEESEYLMMYDDAHADWGHRDNILDKYHTHVSIGIAYDDYYFAFVQNFENIYIELDDPIQESKGYSEISGTILSGKLFGIDVYYDETPTIDVYEKFKEQEWYDSGEFIAIVVEPARAGYYYEQPPDYLLIEAKKWNTEEQSFDIAFNLRQVMDDKNGVYTIVILLEDDNHNVFEGISHSFFVR